MAHHETLPDNNLKRLRALSHELSNSLEVILQAHYLLEHSEPSADEKWAAKWVDMIGKAVKDATAINVDIRQILRAATVMQTEKESGSTISGAGPRRHTKKNAAS